MIIRVVDKFQTLSVVVHKSAAAIQIIVGMPTNAVLFRQRFGTELSVGLCLIQFNDSLLAILKVGTMLQFMLDFCLRQNKSGGRFLVLRSVDCFNLLGFGGDAEIEKTQL